MFAHSFRFSSSFFRNAACAVLILVVVPPGFLADHGNVLAVALLIAAIAICWWIRDSWQEQFFDRNRAARGTHSAENRVRVIEMPAETFMRSERCPKWRSSWAAGKRDSGRKTIMTHPFRTLLFELFFEPILRLWQRVFGFGEAAGLQENLKTFVLGHKPGRIRDSALNRLLQKVRSANFNAMQITAIHTSRFLGVPINSPASVERADRSKR